MACKVKRKTPVFIDCDGDSTPAENIDLGYTASPFNGVVTNTVGNNATIPVVNDTNAGLMTPSQKQALENSITSINLAYISSLINGEVTNSNGTGFTVPPATITNAGLMTPALLIGLNSKNHVIQVANIQDGDNINHGLNGIVLIQFIDELQIRGGFYAEYLDANNSTFRTPVSGTFSGYLLCTKLS